MPFATQLDEPLEIVLATALVALGLLSEIAISRPPVTW
jgi:hypothetical protein